MYKRWLTLFLGLLISGCGSTPDVVVDYRPESTFPQVYPQRPSVTLTVIQFGDRRDMKDTAIILPRKTRKRYDITGLKELPEPLADYFRSGLVVALQDANFNVTREDGIYTLAGTVTEFDFALSSTLANAQPRPEMSVKFVLRESGSNRMMWEDSIYAKGPVGITDSTRALRVTSDEVIRQLFEDRWFVDFFRE